MLCRRFSQTARCSGGVGVEPACCLEVEMFVCARACLSGVERTLSGGERTAPDPSFSVCRQVEPAETPTSSPDCSQIFISALFCSRTTGGRSFPPPPRCVSGTGRDVTTRAANGESPDAARRGSGSANAPIKPLSAC